MTVFLWTAAVNVVGSAFTRGRQGTGLGFLSTSIPGGFAVAHATAPLLDGWIGWELGFLAFDGVSAVALWVYARGFDLPRDADPQRVPPGAGEPLGVGRRRARRELNGP